MLMRPIALVGLRRVALPAALMLSRTAFVAGQSALPVSPIHALARVWGEARYFHPLPATAAIDWDSIGASAVPNVERAQTHAGLALAIGSMLAPLNDPATRVIFVPESSAPRSSTSRATSTVLPSSRWVPDSVLVITLGPIATANPDAARRALARLTDPASRATRVVLDLRATGLESSADVSSWLARARLDRALIQQQVCAIPVRRRSYTSFPSTESLADFTGWRQADARCFTPASNVSKSRVVFVVDSLTPLPALAPAMRAANLASIVSVGPVTDESLVPLDTIPVADGLAAQMRLGLLSGCAVGMSFADTVVSNSSDAIAAALAVARPGRESRTTAPICRNADDRPPLRAASIDTLLPSRPRRIVAAFEIYNAVRFFDPHVALVAGGNWDSVFTALLPAIADASTRTAYVGAISRFAAALNDGHATIPPNRLLGLFGYGFAPVAVRLIENRLVVTDIFDSTVAAGVKRGDVILTVDGVDAKARFADVRQYIPGSTSASRDAFAAKFFLAGAEGSTAALELQDARGKRTVRVARRPDYVSQVFGYLTGEAMRLLPGNVGYVDLNRLPAAWVDSMFARFKNTKALILDLRGYPQGTQGPISGRLARAPVPVTTIRIPIIDGPGQGRQVTLDAGAFQLEGGYREVTQWAHPVGGSPYAGRVFVLADERSMSQSEHATLFFKAAGRATIVGDYTAGADGNYTSLTVAGGVGVAFTSMAVLMPNGTPIQGVGVRPDVRVTPTIAGIRAGRDEVLDCAVKLATTAAKSCGAR